jgi:DNA helicase-4
LLARFTFTLPNKSQLASLNNQFENLAISGLSYHRSKGQEADFVVMLGLETGKHGFPSQKKTHPLLDALLPEAEKHSFAEERRLFYVGLTRAKSKAYLICDMALASEFVIELLEDESKLATRDFFMSYAQGLFQLIKCKRCETGGMVGRTSQYGDFFGCSNFPLCENKEKACIECGNAMQHVDRYRVCINPECQSSVPSCPGCGYDMAHRNGKYGEFWSCTNYRAGGPSCGHKEQVIALYDKALQEQV